MLELKHLTKKFRSDNKDVPLQVLKDISLSFEEKGMVFILGDANSGKSVLLNLIGGVDVADSGEIVINELSTKDFDKTDYARYRNDYIGFVLDEYDVPNDFTVRENISFALKLQSGNCEKQDADGILMDVELIDCADKKLSELSGEQKKKLSIALSIIKDAPIIIADEPAQAFDLETNKTILNIFKKLSDNKLIIVGFFDEEIAMQYADRIIELSDGEVLGDKTRRKTQGEKLNVEENSFEYTYRTLPLVEIQRKYSSAEAKSKLSYQRALVIAEKSMRKKRFGMINTKLLSVLFL